MKNIPWKVAIFTCCSVFLTCCSTSNSKNPTQMASNLLNRESVTSLTHQSYPAKDPKTVSLFTKEANPNAAYRVIGIASVSKRNIFGGKRQEMTLNNMMKKLAASIGGDGLIDIDNRENDIKAKVIVYQKILI